MTDLAGRSALSGNHHQEAAMSNHFSAAKPKPPGDDARLDLTDLCGFQAPADPGKTVPIMNEPFPTSR
ncbi:hypothetical protein ACFRAO_31680 [Streptomyces sp. NPDC056656]|uniref:hypothetical protein n=1 Tax=Streptomyces sp. NPDC056656 TaxID=3345895 RepID=UPI0036CCAFE5